MHASELLDQPDREAVSVPIPDPLTTATPRRRRASLPVISVAISIVALLSGSALFLSGYSMGRQSAVEPGTPGDEGMAFQPFWDTYHTIEGRYAGGPVDREAVVQGAIKGMIGALDDPYSLYLTSDEFKDSLRSISGDTRLAGPGPRFIAPSTFSSSTSAAAQISISRSSLQLRSWKMRFTVGSEMPMRSASVR